MKNHRQRLSTAVLIAILTSLGVMSGLAQRPQSGPPVSPDDQVISDDLVVTGKGCFGAGCVNGEPFENEQLRLRRVDTPRLRLMQTGNQFGVPVQSWDIAGNSSFFYVYDATASRFPFYIAHNAPSQSIMIAADGNIGLGTFFPAGKLHAMSAGNQLSIFQSSDNQAVQFRLQTNSTNRRFVALNAAGTQQSQLVFGDNGAFDFLGATVSDVRMSLLANGNVGIGTNTPNQKLSVNGTAGKPGGGSWATFSDERLKDIKGEFTSGLDAVMKLKPIRYEYKADNAEGIVSEGEHIGFGAAAVEKIIPEAVSRNADGYLMIDNDPILWTMLNAIKEQNAQNAELRTEIKEQNARMKEQSVEIKQLRNQTKEIAQLREQLMRLQTQVVLHNESRQLPRTQAVAEVSP